ncbi:MAG: poly-gamma-glutamate hydrolase family protein, partial [Actinobacteria bacterium]|nr:poly-gamma-glutamate hydrolase family protein [Actinomycetota bacterium]
EVSQAFADLLARPGVEEVCELRSRFGFMAFHGGALEEMTDIIARAAAERTGASYYGVHQPKGGEEHIPSTHYDPAESPRLAEFIGHVEIVITVHGYGRPGFYTRLLLGGRNRDLAEHLGASLRTHLPAYEIATDVEQIPSELRGLHHRNPVNLPPRQGVQLELPPRVRGTTPLFADWEGPGLPPHTQSLVDALVHAVDTWAG